MPFSVERWFPTPGTVSKPRFFSQHDTAEECFAEIDFQQDAIIGGHHYRWRVVDQSTGKVVPNMTIANKLAGIND